MDEDFDFSLAPSEVIYPCRVIRLDPANQDQCYQGNYNGMGIGVSAQQSANAPGQIGVSAPYPLATPAASLTGFLTGSSQNVPVYGEGRKCLIDVDPNFGGQIKPNDLVISSNSGYARKASPFGPWNQWVIGIALSFANSGQSLNLCVKIFPWQPTGS